MIWGDKRKKFKLFVTRGEGKERLKVNVVSGI